MNTRILITGAGGPAAISIMKALDGQPYDLFAADMSAYGSGLYLVPECNRFILPAGSQPAFVPRLFEICRRHRIDIVIPTCDAELLPVARARSMFERNGVRVMLSPEAALERCLDKFALYEACKDHVPVPTTAVLTEEAVKMHWNWPVIVKPRTGSGSRGVVMVNSRNALARLAPNENLIVQEYLPGDEYSVDVFVDRCGTVHGAVPRARLRIDSGVAVASRTLRDEALQAVATAVAAKVGVVYAVNVQIRLDAGGVPRLLEVNARFPGTMALTVKAGANMPLMSVHEILGIPLADDAGDFEELAMVRYWRERYIDPAELNRQVIAQSLSADEDREFLPSSASGPYPRLLPVTTAPANP